MEEVYERSVEVVDGLSAGGVKIAVRLPLKLEIAAEVESALILLSSKVRIEQVADQYVCKFVYGDAVKSFRLYLAFTARQK